MCLSTHLAMVSTTPFCGLTGLLYMYENKLNIAVILLLANF